MEETLDIDGKTYMASSSAAKATGYAPDYIGQLCRSGKIEAVRVGRVWFVDVASLSAYIVGDGVPTNTSNGIPRKTCSFKKNVPVPASLPEVSNAVFPTIVESVFAIVLSCVVVLAGVRFLSGHQVVTLPAFPSVAVSATALHTVVGGTASVVDGMPTPDMSRLDRGAQAAYAVYRAITDAGSTARLLLGRMLYGALALLGFPTSEGKGTPAENMLVVVPAAVTQTENDALKEKIRSSFSDDVEVSLNADGSGIITPVFKSGKKDEYMFVMVPVTQ